MQILMRLILSGSRRTKKADKSTVAQNEIQLFFYTAHIKVKDSNELERLSMLVKERINLLAFLNKIL